MKKNGFTLIEMIVVVGVMTILGFILTNTLVQTLRGENKVKIINQVKENGQTALNQLTNDIRQAGNIFCVGNAPMFGSPTANTIVIQKGDATGNTSYTRYRFYPPLSNKTKNGYIGWDHLTSVINTTCTDPQGATKNLTDTDTKTGVSIDYLSGHTTIFSVSSKPGYPDVVTIEFRAFPGVEAGTTYETQVSEGGIIFSTSVQVRGGK